MCTCASCEYTDGFASKGFAEWPRGNPAGRKSAAMYTAHVAFSRQWGRAYDGTMHGPAEVTSSKPRGGTRAADGGAYRSYPDPSRPDTRQGWTTAAYVEAFIALNGYVTPEKIAKHEAYQAEVRRGEQAARKREKEMDRMRKPKRPPSRLVQLARELRKAA